MLCGRGCFCGYSGNRCGFFFAPSARSFIRMFLLFNHRGTPLSDISQCFDALHKGSKSLNENQQAVSAGVQLTEGFFAEANSDCGLNCIKYGSSLFTNQVKILQRNFFFSTNSRQTKMAGLEFGANSSTSAVRNMPPVGETTKLGFQTFSETSYTKKGDMNIKIGHYHGASGFSKF